MTTSMRRLIMAVVCLLAMAMLPASPASASTRDKIIQDCADDGVLQGDYSASELRDARQNLPSDVAEYTDCADVLRRAELPDHSGADGTGAATGSTGATGGGTGGGPGAGGGLLTPSTDADRAALTRAAAAGGQPVTIDGGEVVPGASGLRAAAIRNDVPGTLLAALLLLLAAGAALVVPAVRRLVPATGSRRS